MKNILLTLLASTLLLFNFAPMAAAFDPLSQACNVNGKVVNSATCKDKGASTDNPVTSVIGTAVKALTILIGVAAIIMVIISGAQLVSSAGNAEAVAKAKNRLTAALTGAVIAALAWTFTTYILNHIT